MLLFGYYIYVDGFIVFWSNLARCGKQTLWRRDYSHVSPSINKKKGSVAFCNSICQVLTDGKRVYCFNTRFPLWYMLYCLFFTKKIQYNIIIFVKRTFFIFFYMTEGNILIGYFDSKIVAVADCDCNCAFYFKFYLYQIISIRYW